MHDLRQAEGRWLPCFSQSSEVAPTGTPWLDRRKIKRETIGKTLGDLEETPEGRRAIDEQQREGDSVIKSRIDRKRVVDRSGSARWSSSIASRREPSSQRLRTEGNRVQFNGTHCILKERQPLP